MTSAPTPSPLLPGWGTLARATSLAVVCLGAVVTFAWIIDWHVVTRLHPSLPSMKVTTSTSFVLLGLSLYLLSSSAPGRSRRRSWGGALGLVVVLRSLLHCLPDGWGAMDLIFPLAKDMPLAMRMSESTTVCFILTGTWATLEAYAPRLTWRRWLIGGTLVIAYFGLVAVGYDAAAFYDLAPFSSMAVHTLFGHLALACVALLAHPGLVLRRALAGHGTDALLVRRLLPTAIVAPLPLGWLRLWGEEQGLYQSGFGVALYTIVLVTCLIGLILGTAGTVASIEEARDSAETLAEARKAELALVQQQLQQSQKMESIGLLAGGITHDFNNILTIIMLYSSLALESLDEDSEAAESVGQIQSAGRRATALTTQLLAFTRRQVLAPQIIDTNDNIQELVSLLKKLVGESITISFDPDPHLGKIRVDPGQLGQVLLNLAANARDAMPEGGTITIATEQVELDAEYLKTHLHCRSGPHVVIRFSDTGMGMDADTQARVFEPFYTTKGVGRGTGLGLSVVYGIVKQSEGNIWVYSEPNQGTTFKVYFPIADQADLPRVVASRTTASPGKNERILLVEDDEQVRIVLTNALQRGGYRVEAPLHPRDALPLFKVAAPPFDLILSDMVMPEIGGLELCRQAQRHQPNIRCLFMSGYPESSYDVTDFLLPSSFLCKPIMPGVLLSRVRELLDEEPASQRDENV